MLPKEYRLRHEKDIKALFASAKSVFGHAAGVKFRKNKRGHSRFAVVVGSKVSKSAVVRNRIRRQIRAFIEQHLEEISPGYDVLVLVRPDAARLARPDIRRQMKRMFKKAGLLRV